MNPAEKGLAEKMPQKPIFRIMMGHGSERFSWKKLAVFGLVGSSTGVIIDGLTLASTPYLAALGLIAGGSWYIGRYFFRRQ